jgi:hypothetical protein
MPIRPIARFAVGLTEIGASEIALLANVVEFRKARLPQGRMRSGQPGEAVKDGDALLLQCRGDRGKIGKVRSHRIQPDGSAGQETAGACGISVFKDALEFVMRGAA